MSDWAWRQRQLRKPLLPLETTFVGFLGLEWDELTTESAAVHFRERDDLKQPLGLMHGGIDSAVSRRSRPSPPPRRCCVGA